MPYNITLADGTTRTILDGDVDYTQLNIGLIGRNSVLFGEALNQNFSRMLSNFAAADSPDTNANVDGLPVTGQLWYDTSDTLLKVFDGTSWVQVGQSSSGSGSIIPSADDVFDLGSAISRWHVVHALHGVFDTSGDPHSPDPYAGIAVVANGDISISGGAGTSISPTTPNVVSLGKSSSEFSELFVKNIEQTGIFTIGDTTTSSIQGSIAGTTPAIVPAVGVVSLGSPGAKFDADLGTLNVTGITNSGTRVNVLGGTDIVPVVDRASDLGKPTERYRRVYAQDLYEDDGSGNTVALEDKYLSKIGVTNIAGTLILDNGTTDTPELVFNVPAGAAGDVNGASMFIDMKDEAMRIGGYTNTPWPNTSNPRTLVSIRATNGLVYFENSGYGGISLPNAASFGIRNTSNSTTYNGIRMGLTNLVEVGNSTYGLRLVGPTTNGLTYSVGSSVYQVYHQGNPPPGATGSYVAINGTSTMTGALRVSSSNILHSTAYSSNNLVSLGNGEVKFTLRDGSGNFSIKSGVGTSGATDTYYSNGSAAANMTMQHTGTGAIILKTALTGNAGNAISYANQVVFSQTTGGVAYQDQSARVGGNTYTGRFSTQLIGHPQVSIESMNPSGKIGLVARNATGVGRVAVLHGRTGAGVSSEGELHVTGDVVAFASDKRLKENVEPIKNAVSKVSQLNGITFTFIEDTQELGFHAVGRHAGVFAQDVQKVLPEAVCPAPFDIDNETGGSKSGDDYLTVRYEKLIPLLIEAIKEQQVQIDELKALLSDGAEK